MKKVWFVAAAAAALIGAADNKAAQQSIASLGQGYLAPASLLDASLFVPPAPARGSQAEKRDLAASKAALKHHGDARWQLATQDADLFSPAATGAFSCVAGFEISPTATPALDTVLRKSLVTLGYSTAGVKKAYQRPRPFIVNRKPQCTPDFDALLRKDGSYPSGHAAVGYGWGLILAELLPDRGSQLVARGRAFADSRRYCNVHWLSDVEAGEVVGGAALARLHADQGFQTDFAAARRELASEEVRTRKPQRDCAAEAAALRLGGLFAS